MDSHKTRQYEMLMRLGQFGAAHADLFPPGSLGARALIDLVARITEVTDQEVARRGAVGEGRFTRAAARTALTRTIRKIRQTAALLAIDEPAIGDSFPRWDLHKSDLTLLQTARSYAVDAAPLAGHLVEHGMPATVMRDLQAEIDAFADAIDRRQRGRSTTGEAHSRIRSAQIGRAHV